MPSIRKQLNVRLDPDTEKIWERLAVAVPAAVGAPLTAAQVLAMAIRALAEKYPEGRKAKGAK